MEIVDIVQKFQLGDKEAFNQLYELYIERAMKTAYFISGKKGIAEDIVQETFTEVFLKRRTLRNPQKFNSWFYSILIRTGGRMAVKQRDSSDTEEIFEDMIYSRSDEVEVAAESKEINLKIQEILRTLSVPMKTVVILYYYNDMTTKEIAKVLECFQGTVKSRLHKARKIIREELLKYYEEDLVGKYILKRSV